MLPIALLLSFAAAGGAQNGRQRVPDLAGTWYLKGDRGAACQIIQTRRDGNAEFVNENGSRVKGTVRSDEVFVPDWGERGRGLKGRIRGDRIEWAGGSFWCRGVPDLAGLWFFKGDRKSACKIIQRRLDGSAVFVNEQGKRAKGTVQGDQVFVPNWGEQGKGLKGRLRGTRIEWAGGGFWSLGVPDLEGTWYLNGDRKSSCKVIQRRLDGRAVFVNEQGERARGTIRGDRVFVPDWGDGDEGLKGRVRGTRIEWSAGGYWSR
jgi:hypothetical protein